MRSAATVIIFILFARSVFAASGTALDPSRVIFSARQLGMGGLAVNFSNDGGGVFSNPAGLAGLEFPQLTTSSRKILMDETQYLLAGWAVPTSFGTFGLGYAGMGTAGALPTTLDPATGRIVLNPSAEAGSYSNSVTALSYTRSFGRFSVGGNLKFFNQALSGPSSDRASGTGIDLGMTFKVLPWLSAGALLQNIVGGSLKWSSVEDKLGGYYKLGAAAAILGASGEAFTSHPQQLRAGIDLDLPNNVLASSNSMLYHIGIEYLPMKNIFLRAGINQEAAGNGLTLGVGMTNNGFRYDYAFVQRPGMPGDNPHYFSLSYVGERVTTTGLTLKKKAAHLKFLHPRDRLITDLETVRISAEAWGENVGDLKRTWTVTGVSATYDAHEITAPERLAKLYFNGKPIDKHGTVEAVEAKEDLKHGRNVFTLVGFTSPEVIGDKAFQPVIGTAEVRVMRVTPFNDTPVDFWAADPIYTNVTLALLTGYPDNSFKPEKGISRAELVTLLVKSLAVPQETLDDYGITEVFGDVAAKHWASKFIAYGSSLKLVSGYPDGNFNPNKVLSRAEGITILARYAGLTEEADVSPLPFPDLKPGFWANKIIAPAKTAGLLKYLSGKDLEPAKEFTRAEAAEVLYQVPAIRKKVNEFWDTGIISAGK